MALTEYATTAAERVQRWAAVLWQELPPEIYWNKVTGESNAIIEESRLLTGKKGDVINFTLGMNLTGDGVTGDTQLENAEEQAVTYTDAVTLDQRRNAVRLAGRLSEQRTEFDQRMNAKNMLKLWLARKIDDDIFTEFDRAPTRVVFGGTATSVATLTTAMTITPARMDSAVARAKKATPKIWPVRVEGGDYYVLVMHTDVAYDLRQNAVWQGYVQNGAAPQGLQNPIFNGRFGVYNGIVLHEHEKVPAATNGGSGGDVPYASCPFVGVQAGLLAWGRRPDAWEKEFDYNNQVGFAVGAIYKFRKATFNATDNASIALRVARTNNA